MKILATEDIPCPEEYSAVLRYLAQVQPNRKHLLISLDPEAKQFDMSGDFSPENIVEFCKIITAGMHAYANRTN